MLGSCKLCAGCLDPHPGSFLLGGQTLSFQAELGLNLHGVSKGLSRPRVVARTTTKRNAHTQRKGLLRGFTESTAMRRFVQGMTAAEVADYVSAYDAALAETYPALPDGRVLFPFTRVFFILERS